jgi:hypothetical protein
VPVGGVKKAHVFGNAVSVQCPPEPAGATVWALARMGDSEAPHRS